MPPSSASASSATPLAHRYRRALRERAHDCRARRGRILAECIVALALLGVAIVSTATLTRAALLLTDDARLSAAALARVSARADAATIDACTSSGTGGMLGAPRIALSWTDLAAFDTRQRHIDATLHHSPLTHRAAGMALDAAGVCP